MDTAEDPVAAEIAAAYADLGASRFGEAVRRLQAVAAAHPDSHAANHACGAVTSNLGRPDLAEPYLRRALGLDPYDVPSQVALAFVLLALGNYAEGWPLSEARLQMPGAAERLPKLDCPAWRGEPLAGKRLLIWPDEGLGDQIQFVRFAAALRARADDVVVCCSAGLERLFAASLDAPVVGLAERMSFPQPDYWTMSGFVPGLTGLTPQTAPQPPYLTAPKAKRTKGARIGVVTQGNPAHLNDAHRSLQPAYAARLRALPGAVSLHPQDSGVADMADTAAIVAGLDLVIAVDTSVAHLAAALGKPTWILLPTIGCDWRWGPAGERTPWYPQARLFRQPRINDWAGVLDAVEAELAKGVLSAR